jgi:adenosylmethionine-8-amino-7-oxononanoate aminotransferase
MTDWVSLDQKHVWHPYSAMHSDLPLYPVQSASGVRLKLADGRELVDGMSSWWCAIHGYNHPVLNLAIEKQLSAMSHVMFGGLAHEPAARLASKLVEITPEPLQNVFFADSGSVSVEVAMKMAIQYQVSIGQPQRHKFVSLRQGYHGDTFGAMSVCDPVTGMHTLFGDSLMQQIFMPAPKAGFDQQPGPAELVEMEALIEQNADQLAAVIVEPVVQGAGGMRFYSPDYLRRFRQWCDRYGLLLIADEIATGFGRSGRLFACEHAEVSPDIMCVGKALTGGYMTLAAALTTEQVSQAIVKGDPGLFMHGPTFMANPLACSVALASIELLLASDWQRRVKHISQGLEDGLRACAELDSVKEVRVLGAIGVVEMKQPVDMRVIQPALVEAGIWVRPFGRLVYLMPPFIIADEDLHKLTSGVLHVLQSGEANEQIITA